MWHGMCICRREDNLWELLIFFHHVVFGNWTEVIRSGSKHSCPLVHLTGLEYILFSKAIYTTWTNFTNLLVDSLAHTIKHILLDHLQRVRARVRQYEDNWCQCDPPPHNSPSSLHIRHQNFLRSEQRIQKVLHHKLSKARFRTKEEIIKP